MARTLIAVLVIALAGCGAGADRPRTGRNRPVERPIGRSAVASRRSAVALGRSVRGRPIRAIVLGDPRAPHPTLVVGCIHGDEAAGILVADRLAAEPAPARSAIWIVGDLNPDGVAAHTRQNAHGVDLNRNFPFGWRPIGHRGDQQYAGPRALSEPESRVARALVLRLRPGITIWFHQPLAVTDRSGGDARIESRFAALSGLPLERLARYPGSVATWENHQAWSGTAFVVELPAGRPTSSVVARYARAVRRLATEPR